MRKLQVLLFLMLLAICMPGSAAQAAETKVQLHDEIVLDAFVTGYNKASRYPVADYSNHSKRGDYEAYVAAVDESNVMLINTNAAGLISNIILVHRGDISDVEQQKLLDMFMGINIALGYPATEEGRSFLKEAFQRLDITSPEITASRLERKDILRDYTFLKSENQAQRAHLIMMEAVVE